MPNWKKVITSGSDAHLNQITASGDVSVKNITVGNVTNNIGTGGPSQILIGSAQGGPSGSIKFQSANSSVTIQQAKDVNSGALTFTEADGTDIVFIGSSGAGAPELIVAGNISASAKITCAGLNAFSTAGNIKIGENVAGNLDGIALEKNISASMNLYLEGDIRDVTNITASGVVSASGGFVGDGSNISNVSATVADESITLAKLAHAAANTVLVRDANSTGDPSFKAVTNTQILIGDGTGFTAAALSGDVTMTNGGAVTIANNAVEEAMIANNAVGNDQMADNAIGNAELKQNDDITLQSLTLTGDLTVNGTTTTIATTNTKVEDKFMFLATGSAGTNTDAGIMVQSGSVDLSGSAFYHDVNVVAGTNPNGGRWSVAKSVGQDVGAVNPLQFVTTVKTETVNPNSTSGSYGAGEMHVNTTTGDIWIRFG